jgi:hypothetical protein
LQANLNQIDADAIVLNGSLGFADDIPAEFGADVEGLTPKVFTATWLSPDVAGVKTYVEAMQQHATDMVENNVALIGWAAMVRFGGRWNGWAPTSQPVRTSRSSASALS